MSGEPAPLPNEPHLWSSLPAGWVEVFNAAVAYLDEHAPRWTVTQVKPKLATLRLYWTGGPTTTVEVWDRVEEILAEAQRVCEICGNPGAIDRTHPAWWRITCPAHTGSVEEREAELRWRTAN